MTEVMEAAGKRNTGLDLLRVLCMLAIVMLHYLYSADALLWSEPAAQGALPPSETVRTLGTLLYCFAICLVNPFVIMSGYLLYDRAFSLRRFFELLCTVVFFGIGVQLVMTLVTGEGPSGAYEWVQALFPVSSRHYWFMTSYLFMYPFAPLVVTGTRAFDKKQLRMLIAIAVVFLSLIKSIVPVRFVTDEGGYNVAWFLLLVLIGAYLRKYEDDGFLAGARSLFWYVICALAIFVLTVGVRTLTISGGGFLTLFEILRDYNFILCLAAGVGIFVFFKDLPLRADTSFARFLAALSAHTIGAYLLHAHPALFYVWLSYVCLLLGNVPDKNPALFLLHCAGSVFIAFFAGVATDCVRALLFRAAAHLTGKGKEKEKGD